MNNSAINTVRGVENEHYYEVIWRATGQTCPQINTFKTEKLAREKVAQLAAYTTPSCWEGEYSFKPVIRLVTKMKFID
jgi:hypothetical protein